jgi:hypothetical protein
MSSVKAKEFWFTLTSDMMTWYKDDEEKEVKYQLPLDGVRVVEAEDTGMFKRKFTFCLIHPMKKAIFKVRCCCSLVAIVVVCCCLLLHPVFTE